MAGKLMHCCFNLVGRHVIRITCSVMVVALDSKWTDHGVNSFKLQSVNEYSFTSCSTHNRPFWRGIIYTGTNKENQTYKKTKYGNPIYNIYRHKRHRNAQSLNLHHKMEVTMRWLLRGTSQLYYWHMTLGLLNILLALFY